MHTLRGGGGWRWLWRWWRGWGGRGALADKTLVRQHLTRGKRGIGIRAQLAILQKVFVVVFFHCQVRMVGNRTAARAARVKRGQLCTW
jgi:hypothetical protein